MTKSTDKTNQKEKKTTMSRRQFLTTSATGIAGFMILRSFTIDGGRICLFAAICTRNMSACWSARTLMP